VLPSASAAATATSSAAVIRGRVRDGAGAPVPQAAITLLDPTGRQLARTTSREDGSYAIDTAELGSLVLIGSALGHQPQVANLSTNCEEPDTPAGPLTPARARE
jgi:hypothetical protein